MSLLAFGASSQPPLDPEVPSPWRRSSNMWVGWDGSVWDLGDTSSGVFQTKGGIKGLHFPPSQSYDSDSPGSHGQRHRGSRVLPRAVEWPIHIFSDAGSEAWRQLDREFWHSFHRDKPGTWTFTSPSGEARSIALRLMDPGDNVYDRDPAFFGWASYLVELIADWPFWQGAPVVRSWAAPTQYYFHGGQPVGTPSPTLAGPPYRISASSTTDNATITNPGDEYSWPVWTADATNGAIDALTVTVDGGTLTAPPVALGHVLTIDTDTKVAYLDGDPSNEVTDQFTAWDARPIPPGEDVEISIEMQGAGTIQVSMPTWYNRGL